MSDELKCSFCANGERAVDQQMAKELFIVKARCGVQQARIEALEQQLAELREAARALLRGIEMYQYGNTPAAPLPGIARPANDLDALLQEVGE